MGRLGLWLAIVALGASACDSGVRPVGLPPTDGSSPDAATMGTVDSGMMSPVDAGQGAMDGGMNAGHDASATADAAAPRDGGVPLTLDIVPGSHVTTALGRVDLRSTRASVRATLGAGQQAAMGRSIDYTLPGAILTVWYANTGLNATPATRIDDDDLVLWIAVTTGFTGRTSDGVGIGSAKSAVTAAFGPAERSSEIDNPPGTLEPYYTQGIIVAYNPSDEVRTITVCRAYSNAPNGQMRLADGEIRFGNNGIRGGIFDGTRDRDIKSILGDPPDAEGQATFGTTDLDVMSYGFIGLEFFMTSSGRVLFMSVHAPYYGTSGSGAGAAGIGSTRTDFESHLLAEDFGSGRVSSGNPGITCYQNRASRKWIGVSYSSETPPTVTSISIALPEQGC